MRPQFTPLDPMWRWEAGRQGSGYRKCQLAGGPHWDLYVLDYPLGSYIPPHVDMIPGRRHYRANLVLMGDRQLHAHPVFTWGPLSVFRSDKLHSVGLVRRRSFVLSLGLSLVD